MQMKKQHGGGGPCCSSRHGEWLGCEWGWHRRCSQSMQRSNRRTKQGEEVSE
jgi:hypothetical protein